MLLFFRLVQVFYTDQCVLIKKNFFLKTAAIQCRGQYVDNRGRMKTNRVVGVYSGKIQEFEAQWKGIK